MLQQLHGSRAARFQNWALALAPRTFVLKVSNSYMDGGRFLFKMRLSPSRRAHSSKSCQQLQGWRAVPFQNWAVALAPRTLVLQISNSYKDGGRVVFKIRLSPQRRAHSSSKFPTVTGMEGGPFSKLGSRFRAAHIRLKRFQQLQGWRAVGFQNWALALPPRTFVLKVSNRYRDGGRFLFKMRISP